MDNDNTRDAAEPSPASASSVGEVLARGIEDIIRIAAEPDWIPVAERLPDECERVMVCNATDGWVTIGSRELTGTYHHWDGDDYEELCEPTHWMPLPEPARK